MAVLGSEAATVSDPKTRYPVGTVARIIVLSRFLPDRLRDAATRWLAKAGVALRSHELF